MERFHGAWNGADAAAVAALFSPDGEFVSPSGAVTSTPAEIGKLLTGEFQEKFHGTTLTTTVDTIHFVQADAALAKGTYKLMGVDVFFGNDPTNHALQACDPCTFKIGVYRPSRSSSGRPFFVF